MLPSSAKQKGRLGQQIVRDLILKYFPALEADDVKSTGMGQPGEDIQLSPAARRLVPFQIEVKNKATSQIHTYYDQAKTHGDYEPLVVVKMDRKQPLAILDAEAFFKILKEHNDYRSRN